MDDEEAGAGASGAKDKQDAKDGGDKAGTEDTKAPSDPTSGSDRFEADVQRILTVFESGQDAVAELAALPRYSLEVEETSYEHLREKLGQLVRAFETDRLSSEDAMQLQHPLWHAGFYPLAVISGLIRMLEPQHGHPSSFLHRCLCKPGKQHLAQKHRR